MKKFAVNPLVFAIAASMIPVTSYAQDSEVEEVIVTGSFRASLANALNTKRNSANNVDAIVAEDMGKMPDLNLAESLQRVPGVAITREGGEGRNITVRGLGPGFSATTLNGMEVPSSTGGLDSSGGVNRGRSFDFNVFASELFNKIVLNKSAKGSLEEGGLASTVELYSAKPFDNPGLHAVVGGSMAVDNLTGEDDPRVVGMFSNTFADDKLGVLVSFAQSERNIRQEGFGSVRWTSAFDNSNRSFVGNDSTVAISGGTPDPLANYPDLDQTSAKFANEKLDYMLFPRLPRMDSFNTDQERTGVTGSFQFRPTDRMEFTLDYLKSDLKTSVSSYNFFAQFRNTFASITPTNIVLDDAGRVAIAGEFTGVTPRVESRGQFSDTEFEQVVLSGKFDLTDNLKLDLMFGNAAVVHDEEQYRFNLDALNPSYANAAAPTRKAINGLNPTYFAYDFRSDGDIAEMSYGFDITDPLNYHFTAPTLRKDIVERENDTFRADLTWDLDESSIKTGVIWNDRNITSERHDPTAGSLTDPVAKVNTGSGTATILPITQATVNLTTTLDKVSKGYGDAINPPAGFPTNFIVNDFAATKAAYNAGSFTLNPNDPTTFDVTETTTGAYTEYNRNMQLAGMPLMVNAGLRYVETEVTSIGVAGTEISKRESDYKEWLPSMNATLEVVDDVLVRFSANRNLSRPNMSSMTATVNATPINGNLNIGNPGLKPTMADAVDLGVEWYFAEESVVAITFFHKDIDSFILSDTVASTLSPELKAIVATAFPQTNPSSPTFDPNGVSINDEWNISTPVNGEGATVDGYEISYQQPFSFLPSTFEGLGMFANYTYVDSEITYPGDIKGPLSGLSENSYNYGVYFERENFGARVVVNGRDDYVTSIPGSDRNYSENTTGPTRVDMSAFYNITDNVKVSLEVINLTEEDERLYTTGPVTSGGDLDLVREVNNTGREISLGIRATF
ncbi:TonB-dependent receptor [Cellvibrio sp. pealriver]|uniref:TonB-dependent receptor n=1 Tax=Cellvibrio sp. pealriver TaxID=1622269 RepID=UPI00066FE6AC|nr:TonB-dependent receptor [Cellvibrio sp. pealriver]